MSLAVALLGRPRIIDAGRDVYRLRSQKSWALLALLHLTERPMPRSELAEMLFSTAEDPLAALRWSLAELRRALGDQTMIFGDPVVLRLAPGASVDVDVLKHGSWRRALSVDGLGSVLLGGLTLHGSAAFDLWLSAERRRIAAATAAILHEAALGLNSAGDLPRALECAQRAVRLDPFDENLQALVIRLHRESGDVASARAAYQAYQGLLRDELDVEPGLAVESAWRSEPATAQTGPATAVALLEAGQAAVAAGAVPAGMTSLRMAVGLADQTGSAELRVRSRVLLAETLIHSVRGLDEEGIAALHEANVVAHGSHMASDVARIRAELGYVDFLRARYDRAARWLTGALDLAGDDTDTHTRAGSYLGAVHSDRGEYRLALAHLTAAVGRARASGLPRRTAYALSMLGRAFMLRGELDVAAEALREATALSEGDHWLSYLAWPQALLGEVMLAQGEVTAASATLEQAFARACQVGDPCWEGISARGLALVSEARGDVAAAFDLLDDAERRSSRVPDAYVWLSGHILDARCSLGGRHSHPRVPEWIAALSALAERTGMRELRVRALVHGALAGRAGDADAARGLAPAIENPVLQVLLEQIG